MNWINHKKKSEFLEIIWKCKQKYEKNPVDLLSLELEAEEGKSVFCWTGSTSIVLTSPFFSNMVSWIALFATSVLTTLRLTSSSNFSSTGSMNYFYVKLTIIGN